MGFLESVDEILSALPNSAQRAMFSATVPSGVEAAVGTVLRDPVRVEIGRAMSGAATIEQRLVFVGREDGKLLELRQMAVRGFKPPVLVFVQSRERAEDLVHELRMERFGVEAVHAGRSPEQVRL